MAIEQFLPALNLVAPFVQQGLQQQLMHENAAINLEQWKRETEYNDPINQMNRLRRAGLNPDLAIQGSVSNTAGQANLSHGTPAAPNVGASVSAAVQQSALLDAERDKLEADAGKTRSETDLNINELTELQITFLPRLNQLMSNIGLTDAKIDEVNSNIMVMGQQLVNMAQELDNLQASYRLLNAKVETEHEQTRVTHYAGEIEMFQANHQQELFDATLEKIWSESGLNKAHAGFLKQQTRELVVNFADICRYYKNRANYIGNLSDLTRKQSYSYVRDGNNYFSPLDNFYRAKSDFVKQEYAYYPYLMTQNLILGQSFLQHDADGNLLKDKNGVAIATDFSTNSEQYMRGVECVQRSVDVIESATKSFANVYSPIKFGQIGTERNDILREGNSIRQDFGRRISEARKNDLDFRERSFDREMKFREQQYEDAKPKYSPNDSPYSSKSGRLTQDGQKLMKRFQDAPAGSKEKMSLYRELMKSKYWL